MRNGGGVGDVVVVCGGRELSCCRDDGSGTEMSHGGWLDLRW